MSDLAYKIFAKIKEVIPEVRSFTPLNEPTFAGNEL
jgi:hypothetical protein